METKQRNVLFALVAAASMLVMSACGTSADGYVGAYEDMVASSEPGFAAAPSEEADWAAQDDSLEAEAASGGAESISKIAVSGYADVITKDPVGAAKDFLDTVLAMGGRIDSEWSQDDPAYLSASVSARVPADKYEEITATLSDLGRVQTLSTNADDLGQQYVDYTARKEALEDSIVRVKELADDAKTTQDLLQAEEILTERQSELDSLVQQLEWIDRQVDMSSISVSFATERVGSSDFSLSWAWIVNLLAESLRVLVTLLVFILPWVIIGAIVFFPTRRWVRSRRKNRGSTAVTASEENKDSGLKDAASKDTVAQKKTADKSEAGERDIEDAGGNGGAADGE